MPTYETQAQIDSVVQGFESCSTDKTQFKHQDHLTVAVCYLQQSTVPEAVNKMRSGLLRFLNQHGVDRQKYNETITVFWFEVVADALGAMPTGLTLVEQCNRVVEQFCSANLALQYYSAALLFSERAREEFVDPDLKDWQQG